MKKIVWKAISSIRLLRAVAILTAGTGLLVGYRLSNPYAILLPPFILLAAGATFVASDRSRLEVKMMSSSRRVIVSVYLLLFSAIVYLYAEAGQTRTLTVIGGVLALYLLALILAFTGTSTVGRLTPIIFSGLIDRLLVYWVGSLSLGIDSQSHNRMINDLAAAGSTEPLARALSKYADSAVYHIFTATGVHIMDIPVRAASLMILISATVVPALVIFIIVQRWWSPEAACLSVWVFVTANHTLYWAVHTIPTTYGFVLFTLVALITIRYLEGCQNRSAIIPFILFIAIAFAHQISMLITVIGVTVISSIYYIEGRTSSKMAGRQIIIAGSVLTSSWIYTGYRGPEGDLPSFLIVVLTNFVRSLFTEGISASIPEDASFVIVGSDALSLVQVFGFTFLVGLTVFGGLYWIQYQRNRGLRQGVAIGAVAAVAIGVAFGGPLVGTSFLLPRRWFIFICLLGAIFAGPAVIGFVQGILSDHRHPVTVIGVVMLLLLPATIIMGLDYRGAVDDPVLTDDAPEAARLSTTAPEAHQYQFGAEFVDDRIVADHFASEVLSRRYDTSAAVYRYEDGESVHNGSDQVYLWRLYAGTEHGSYYVRFNESNWVRVYAPIPSPGGDEIYDNGDGSYHK